MKNYDSEFFDYVNSGAIKSAERLLPVLQKEIHVNSVLDVGCGQGAWLSVWKTLGVANVIGVDGSYVERDKLLIPNDFFHPANLSVPLDLGCRFDLVQCLEVAEHLPPSSSSQLVDSLIRHGDMILFSAAPPGQGGDMHINEQSYEYWRNLFAERGYLVVDYIRQLVFADQIIEPWYRYNTFLYVSTSHVKTLSDALSRAIIPNNIPLQDIAPTIYKFRKWIVRLFPVPLATAIAKVKERIISRLRRLR